MRKVSFIFLISIVLGFSSEVKGQEGFNFLDRQTSHQDISFELINNLVVIPVEINGKKLNFILDTGVNKTIVFNAKKSDTVFFRGRKVYKLQGLGDGEPLEAIISRNNKFKLKNLVNKNQDVYIILNNDQFDLSSKMGVTIHGVIGYDLLKSFVLRINYNRKKIRFYNPEKYTEKICRKCEVFPLNIYQNKPYLDVNIVLNDSVKTKVPVKMLIDSGGSDALWLFEYSKENILPPKKFFDDFLGFGLSGTIYGKRSRVSALNIGKFSIEKPTVSFLDTVSTAKARKYTLRNGSIGSNILRRFVVWFDYANNKLILKKSGSFTRGFEYNMSGLEVVYDGKVLVKEKVESFAEVYGRNVNESAAKNNTVSLVTNYVFRFKPSFKIGEVLEGSPAHIAGVQKNDILLKINGNNVHNYKLSDIVGKFQEKDNKRIKLTIRRNGKIMDFEFRLKRII